MSITSRRFDDYLENFRVDELKAMARIWGGKANMRKRVCIETIREGLNDPERVKAAIDRLKPFEQTALALIKQMGGALLTCRPLMLALRISGVDFPKPRRYARDPNQEPIDALMRRGLVMSEASYALYHYSYGYGSFCVFADERLLAHIDSPDWKPFVIAPVDPPSSSTCRRPTAVILDIISLLRAIDELGGLPLTKSGKIRQTALRQLKRVLGWKDHGLEVDGLPFHEAEHVLTDVLRASGWLTLKADSLRSKASIDQFAKSAPVEQIRALMNGFVNTRQWLEAENQSRYNQEHYVQARTALTYALKRLPTDAAGFFAVDAFDMLLFDHIAEEFSLGYHRPRSALWDSESAESWRAERREGWLSQERPWLLGALTTWLYYLGLIELGWAKKGDAPSHFRLTDLGSAVLHPEFASPLEFTAKDSPDAWVVQPNFDVIVYLDRASPEQLAFLARHAERERVQQHTATYRLIRDSVYRGLESGTSLRELLDGLRAGSSVEVPQNISAEIHQWAEMREQLTLRQRTKLLEFPGRSARQAALDKGVQGTPVGEKFLRLAPGQSRHRFTIDRIDYAKPLPKCLSVTEKGVLKVTTPSTDFLLESQLDRWADRLPDGNWQLTEASVPSRVKGKGAADELFEFLEARLCCALPAFLAIALRSWAGEKLGVEMETVTILRCSNPEVFEAIVKRRTLKPYFQGKLAPGLLLVETGKVAALRKQLAWAGLEISGQLVVKRHQDAT